MHPLPPDETSLPLFDSGSPFGPALFSMVAESVALTVMVWDLHRGIVYLSDQWLALTTGIPRPAQVSPDGFRTSVHPEDLDTLDQAIVRGLKGTTSYYSTEFRIRLASGDWIWVEMRGRVVEREGDGRARLAMATLLDISHLKRMAQTLKENEAQYRAMYDSSVDGMMLTRPDGVILSANPAACRLTGYSEAELVERGREGLFDGDDERLSAMLRQRDESGMASGELTLIRKDGRRIEVELSSGVFTGRTGVRMTSIILRDVTSRRETERSLLRLTNMYSARSQCNQAIMRGLDRQTLLSEICRIAVDCGNLELAWIGMVDDASGMVEPVALHGPGKAYLDQVRISIDPSQPEGAGPVGNAIREGRKLIWADPDALPDVEPWRGQLLRQGFRSGAVFPILQGERVIGALTLYSAEKNYFDAALAELLAWMANDISFGLENLQRDMALQTSELRFRTLWETSTDAILMLDPDANIRYANPAVREVFGHDPQDLVGRDLGVLQPVYLRESPVDSLRHHLHAGERSAGWGARTAQALHSDGSEFPIELTFSNVSVAGNRQVVAFIRDITERKLAEELIVRQNQLLKMMTSGRRLEEILDAINRLIEDQAREALCATLVAGDDGAGFAWCAAESLPRAWRQLLLTQRTGAPSGFCSAALHARAPVLVSDVAAVAEAASVQSWAGPALAYGVRACFAWPILDRRGQVLGVFAMHHRQPGEPTEREYKLAQLATELAGLAIENRRSEERIRYLAHYDELTGLPNRSMFTQALARTLAQGSRGDHPLAILFLDLDRFKNINDGIGHAAGDEVLKEAARRLSRAVREGDMVARLGGDEFVVLIEKFPDAAALAGVARKLIAEVAAPMAIEGREFRQTVSIGIATFPDDGRDAHSLVKHADIAMYRAKEQGRNDFRFYSAQMSADSMERMTLESGLRRAIEQNEFTLYYQPKLSMQTGEITGMEALIRWRHPERGLLGPQVFIPLAEENGLIVPIGQWVLQTACLQMRVWQEQGWPPVRVAVNLSARQFAHEGLAADISLALAQSGLPPDMLELEITESLVMNNVDHAVRTLAQLKAMRVHVSLDDFGTGYSSLANLKRFPLDSVKIDRSFIQDIPHDPNDAAITRAVIAMAHALNLKVVAEGVENPDQLAFLREHDCDEIQGNYFSPALDLSGMEAFLPRARGHAAGRRTG